MDEKILRVTEENLLKENSRLKKWTPVTVPEMCGFLAVILNMGILLLLILHRTGIPHGLVKFHFSANCFQRIVLR